MRIAPAAAERGGTAEAGSPRRLRIAVVEDDPIPLVGVTDVDSLFKFDSNYCGKRAGGQLFCIRFDGSNWVESSSPYVGAPSGSDWLSYDFGYRLSCGIKSSGQRFCMGPRGLGSLGDGFDERLPAPIVLPD